MEVAPLTRAKYPRSLIAGPYGHPFHPIAVIIPIGAWVASIVFDITALLSEDQATYAMGSRILIIIGLAGALLAAILGFLDWLNLARGTRARSTGTTHMVMNLVVMVLFVGSLLLRIGNDTVPVLAFIASAAGLLLLGISGWLGGKLAHTYGVRVADERTQTEGLEPIP